MKAYLMRLTAASILAALVRRASPEGGAGNAAKLGAGLLILLTALGPLGEIDLVEAAEHIALDGYGDVLTTAPVDKAANTLLEELITDTAESYILDKAQALGMTVTAEVSTDISEGYPVPWSVQLHGECTTEQQTLLGQWIQDTLGIPEERQEW